MRYVEFRNAIQEELGQNPAGFTWRELRERLDLPYDSPCPTWIRRMEQELAVESKRLRSRIYLDDSTQ